MRIHVVLLILTIASACSSTKKAQQARINEAYDARTEAQRNAPAQTPAAPASAQRAETSTPAVPKVSDGPSVGSVPSAPPRLANGWMITSIKSKFLAIDSTAVRVYMNMTARNPTGQTVTNPADFISHFTAAYVAYPDYNNRERIAYGNVTPTAENVSRGDDYLTLTFDIKRPGGSARDLANAVLLTEITETATGTKARNDLSLRFRTDRLSDRFALFDPAGTMPQLRNYVNAGDTILIRNVTGTRQPLTGFRYRHDFEAASSPMNTASRQAPKSLNIDSTLSITTNEPFILPKEGLYYFMADTTDESGIGLVVADRRYPKLTRPEKLIRPVLYMSTSSEINELNQAQDTKKAFDRYWLSLMSGNEEVARRTLKSYFTRVEEANRLFTSYKEGWKTDKGMIYIVLGAPDRVQRNREREVWVYNRRANVSEVNFTFTKKPNQFVEDHYELVRYMEYQPIWYPIVEAWRTGAIRE